MHYQKTKAFTLVEIIIVVAIIGILIAIAVPGFVKAREQSRQRACLENLASIKAAKSQLAQNDETFTLGTAVSWDDLTYTTDQKGESYLRRVLSCPAGGKYTIGAIGDDPTCDVHK